MFELTLRAVSYPLLPSCTNDERFNSAHKRPEFGRHSNILIAILPRVRARDEFCLLPSSCHISLGFRCGRQLIAWRVGLDVQNVRVLSYLSAVANAFTP